MHQIRPVATVLSRDRFAVLGMVAHHPGLGEQPQRLLQIDGIHGHRREQAGGARLDLLLPGERSLVLAEHLGDIRSVATALGHDHPAGVGIRSQLVVTCRSREQLLGLLGGEFIRSDVEREIRPLLAAQQVRAVASHPHHCLRVRNLEARVGPRIDLAASLHHRQQTVELLRTRRVISEIEPLQDRDPLLPAGGDQIQDLLHPGREVEVDQVAEIGFEQPDDGEPQPGGHQGAAALHHVVAVDQVLGDGRVGGRPADATLLQLLGEAGLGVARRWFGLVPGGLQRAHLQRVTGPHDRQPTLGPAAILVVRALLVGGEETGEDNDGARSGELGSAAVPSRGTDAHGGRGDLRIGHLRGQGALPDQVVEGEVVADQLTGDIGRGSEDVAGGADRLVRLLGVLGLVRVPALRRGDMVGTEHIGRLRPRGSNGRGREHRGVSADVGDVAPLVKSLGHPRHPLGPPTEFPGSLLLQR